MARSPQIDDLFGHVPQPARMPPPSSTDVPSSNAGAYPSYEPILYPALPPGGHTPDTIRPILLDVLAEARRLDTLDWSPRKLRAHTAMVPYMAEWLKGGEGDRLMLEFKAEMDRLHAPVDQVAPNWRRIWGLAA